jgi:hypothetical protein
MSIIARRRLWSFFEALYSQELTESAPKQATPSWLKTPLLVHQQSALAAALALEKGKHEGIVVGNIAGDEIGGTLYTNHGILGDAVGSGKSLIALALIKNDAPPACNIEFLSRGWNSSREGRDVGLLRTRSQLATAFGTVLRQVSTSLIIVPHALMGQWESYIKKDTTLTAKYIKKRQDAVDEHFARDIETVDVIVVSATMWPVFKIAQQMRNILWKRIFIDEADSISITTNEDELYGCFYWFITASWMNLVFSNGAYFNVLTSYFPFPETPVEVINRVKMLQSGDQVLVIPGCRHNNISRRMCGIAPNHSSITLNAAGCQSSRLIIHSGAEYIKTSFAQPIITHSNIMCETPTNIFVLDSFISPAMMERLHAGDVDGALEMMGINVSSESELTSAVTASLQKDLDNAKRTYEYKRTMDYSSEVIKAKALEACQTKIASVESRILAIQERISSSAEQTCPICYCNVSSPALTPCCSQLFCFSCLCESLKRASSCPLCRTRINDIKEVRVMGEAKPPVATLAPASVKRNKKDTFLEFVRSNKTAKILMFSGYDASFQRIESTMQEEGLTFATATGSQARISKLIREFAAGKYNVLFLNARNMGAGLNIEMASHVVLFHKMSGELEDQIVGRANRLGRKDPLSVVHLLHDNELNVITHV